jgi:hypothetical protein
MWGDPLTASPAGQGGEAATPAARRLRGGLPIVELANLGDLPIAQPEKPWHLAHKATSTHVDDLDVLL